MLSFRSPFVAKFTRKGTDRLLTKNLFLISDVLALCSAEANESPCSMQNSMLQPNAWEVGSYRLRCCLESLARAHPLSTLILVRAQHITSFIHRNKEYARNRQRLFSIVHILSNETRDHELSQSYTQDIIIIMWILPPKPLYSTESCAASLNHGCGVQCSWHISTCRSVCPLTRRANSTNQNISSNVSVTGSTKLQR